jgi:hypothetical protein
MVRVNDEEFNPKVEVVEKVEYDTDDFSWEPLPVEFWELQELVQNGCPDAALKAFRKTVIGKKNPLTASEADAAIAGALAACRTGRIINTRKKERAYEIPSVDLFMCRAYWYATEGIPVCFARPYGYEWTKDELDFIHEDDGEEIELSFLSFDDDAVDRVEAP